MNVLRIEIPLFVSDRIRADGLRRPCDVDPIARARIRDIADALELPVSWLTGPGRGRNRRVHLAKCLAAYTLRRFEGLSFPEIGRALGYRDHTSAMYLVRRAEELYLDGASLTLVPPTSGDAGVASEAA